MILPACYSQKTTLKNHQLSGFGERLFTLESGFAFAAFSICLLERWV